MSDPFMDACQRGDLDAAEAIQQAEIDESIAEHDRRIDRRIAELLNKKDRTSMESGLLYELMDLRDQCAAMDTVDETAQ